MPPTLTITPESTNNNFVWSENKIIHRIYLSGTAGLKVIVEIRNVFGDTVATLAYPAVDGYMEIDLQPILKELVYPNRPVVKSGTTYITHTLPQNGTAAIKIYTRLSSWAAPGLLTEKVLIYGGWDNMDFSLSGFQNKYSAFSADSFFCNKGDTMRLITHMPNNRLIDAAQIGFVSYAQEKPAVAGQKITYTAKHIGSYFAARTYREFTFPASLDKTTWNIPIGINQVNLDPLNKGVEFCDIAVIGTSETLARYRIRYDYRPSYKWLDIHYRNSMGGWDFFRFKGDIIFSTDADRQEFELKNTALPTGANNYFNTQLRLKWSAATGYISLQEMVALNDLLRSRDVCLLFEDKYYPLKCITKSLKWNDTRDGLHNETFEFETAGKFNTVPVQLMQFFSKPPELRP